ncbi:VOC family protein [Mesorhizobium sp. YR577]|uniref:VOC family protein n=1 Tax=Mesorhizobium sp. YR577 TaxID=1884373 RepID=UPI0008EA773B|nr:VOC family protein [Mesorhizobium sp. YR577]SFU22385.1 Glyoxalase-like domain-containing protein [Mesorhizobium sp. YR577]
MGRVPDHLIVLVNDPDQAAADYAALGFTVQQRHDSAHGSAAYRFVSFEDGSYILITAFTDPEALKKHRLGPLLAAGEGWGDYSFTEPDIIALTAKLTEEGSRVAGPVDVGNTIADGSKWSLKLLMTGRGTGGDDALPFVVEDVEGRNNRIPAAKPHANGATGISRMVIASPTADSTATTLALISGGTVTGASSYEGRDAWDIDAGAYRITVFADDPAAPLGRKGGGLYATELHGTKAVPEMDMKLTHGALLAIRD